MALVPISKEITKAVFDAVQKVWKTSPPEYLDEQANMLFLGLRVYITDEGIKISQPAYAKDMVKKLFGDASLGSRNAPCDSDGFMSKPYTQVGDDKVANTDSEKKRLQMAIGTLLWLSTRTRPGLSFVVSRMASCATSSQVECQMFPLLPRVVSATLAAS